MLKNICLLLLTVLFFEIPALGAAPPVILDKDKTVWSGEVELTSDVVVPEGKTLIIMPGTKISCVYDYNDSGITPEEWKIIVKGDLIAHGQADDSIVINAMPYGLSAIRVPIDPSLETISISPQQINTKKLKDEFSVFRVQYLALWALLFGSIYYAIKTRKD